MQFLVYGIEQDPNFTPGPNFMAELGQLTADGKKSGVLVATGGLAGTSTRLKRSGGKFTVTDMPSIEAKELMGGWAIIEVKSLDDAIEWSKRFRNITGDGVSEIVRIYGPDDFASA